jgi:hypothetical protein
MLIIFIISVGGFVEGCILNAIHLVTIIGVHKMTSSL